MALMALTLRRTDGRERIVRNREENGTEIIGDLLIIDEMTGTPLHTHARTHRLLAIDIELGTYA